jgi:cell division septal protein FtsQ
MIGGAKRQISKTTAAYIAVGVVLVGLMTFIGTSAFLRVVNIEVEGASLYSIDEIIEASEVTFGVNLMYMDVSEVSKNIRSTLPFINNVDVIRKFPGTLIIYVTESDAIATIAFAGDTLVIDSSGRVLIRSRYKPDGLIEVRGVELSDAAEGQVPRSELGAETKLQYMQDVLAAMERGGIERDVSYLDVSNITNIHFGYLIYEVRLGGARDLRHRIGILPETIGQLQRQRPNVPGVLDMNDPSGSPVFRANQ